MKKFILILIVSAFISACSQPTEQSQQMDSAYVAENKKAIAGMLDSFNLAAAQANFDAYFGYYTPDAVFLGTDATEYWSLDSFKTFAKPYFDRGRAWNFTTVQRQVYLGKYPDIAWFDELLSTQMKICRGSGVVVKQGNTWKVQQYVLSMTVPNSLTDSLVPMKSAIEDSLLQAIRGK